MTRYELLARAEEWIAASESSISLTAWRGFLADYRAQGCPMVRGNKLFDGDWDRKYLHGEI